MKKELEKILGRFDQLEAKVDDLRTSIIPKLQLDQAVLRTEVTNEAKTVSKIHGMIWGGITLAISLTGLAIAYFK